jgi:hypothetical protein
VRTIVRIVAIVCVGSPFLMGAANSCGTLSYNSGSSSQASPASSLVPARARTTPAASKSRPIATKSGSRSTPTLPKPTHTYSAICQMPHAPLLVMYGNDLQAGPGNIPTDCYVVSKVASNGRVIEYMLSFASSQSMVCLGQFNDGSGKTIEPFSTTRTSCSFVYWTTDGPITFIVNNQS